METFEQALPYGDSIVGVGLDSDEQGNPPVKFREVFERARLEGFRLTMHCDVDQENSTAHIRQCLDDIRVERIDHGVNALEDASLIREINQRGLGLTVCPISNSYVAGSLKAPELRELLASGVRATVNSDDPAYFPGYVNENLLAIQPTAEEAAQLARNSFAISWLEPDERSRHLDALETYLERG
jgi:adenosine deaminase